MTTLDWVRTLRGFNRTIFIKITTQNDVKEMQKAFNYVPDGQSHPVFTNIVYPSVIRLCRNPKTTEYYSTPFGWGYREDDYRRDYPHMRVISAYDFIRLQQKTPGIKHK